MRDKELNCLVNKTFYVVQGRIGDAWGDVCCGTRDTYAKAKKTEKNCYASDMIFEEYRIIKRTIIEEVMQ